MKHILLTILFSLLVAGFATSCVERRMPDSGKSKDVRCNVLDSIPGEKPVLDKKYVPDNSKFGKLVTVTFDKGGVQCSELPDGVSVTTDGKGVKFVSKAAGVEFRLSGRSDDGYFSVTSDSSLLVTLSGAALSCKGAAPLQIACGGVTFMQCSGKSQNFITDIPVAADTLKTAAAVSVAGDLVLYGGGSLALCGSRRNALYGTGRVIIDGVHLVVENSCRDGISAVGGVALLGGNLKITSVKDAIKSKRGNVLFVAGNAILSTTGDKGDGVQSTNVHMYGGNVSIKTKGNVSRGLNAKRSVYMFDGSLSVLTEGGVQFAPKKNDYSSSACVKCDETVYVRGGYMNLENRATAGKGINCNGKMQMDGGILLVRNFGNDIVHPTIADAHASAKGIKCDSAIAINGGKVEVLVFGEGERCEGIESKSDIVVGGDASVYVYATDDAVNSTGNFVMNGGKLYAYSAGNDGVDSNAKVMISSGVLVANGSGGPEQGVDCDFDGNFSMTGGTLVSIGGLMGRSPNVPRGKGTTQASVAWSAIELKRDAYMNLCDESGKLILSYKLPRTIERGAAVISSPLLAEGKGYKLAMSDTLISGVGLGCGLYSSGEFAGNNDALKIRLDGMITNVDAAGKSETLTIDTTEFRPGMMPPPPGGGGPGMMPPPPGGGGPGMMPPPPGDGAPGMMPPPGFDPRNIPDSIKEKFFAAGGKFPPPPGAFNGRDEGYNATNLPGGGW